MQHQDNGQHQDNEQCGQPWYGQATGGPRGVAGVSINLRWLISAEVTGVRACSAQARVPSPSRAQTVQTGPNPVIRTAAGSGCPSLMARAVFSRKPTALVLHMPSPQRQSAYGPHGDVLPYSDQPGVSVSSLHEKLPQTIGHPRWPAEQAQLM